MARYPTDRFEDAAKAYYKEFGLVPAKADAAEQVATTRRNAETLAKKLGEQHAAFKGLTSVATLRPSIARRFITISVAPLAPAPKKTSEDKAADRQPAAKQARPARQRKATPAPATDEQAAASA